MSVSEYAGQLADAADLVDVDALIGAYFDERPDPSVEGQRVLRRRSVPRNAAPRLASWMTIRNWAARSGEEIP